MAATKATTSMDISDIQRRMAEIRHDMHQEIEGAVKGAQSLTDWQTMVKSHPWLSLSLASVVGYLIVPKRRTETPTFVSVGTPGPEFMAAASRNSAEMRKAGKWSILGTAVGLVAPIAVRAAQNYALASLEQWLSQHPLPPVPGGDDGRPRNEPQKRAGAGTSARPGEYRPAL